jgi:chromosome segregation ATPase
MLVEKTKDLEQAEIDKADSLNKTEMFEVKVAKELSSKENQTKNLESMFKETVQELTSKLVEKTKDLQQAKTDTANKIGILQDKHANDLSRKQTQIKNLDSKVQEHICQVQKNEKLEATRKEVADGNDAYKKLEGDIKSLKESHESFRNAQEQKQAASRKSEQLESQVKTWTNEANWYW